MSWGVQLLGPVALWHGSTVSSTRSALLRTALALVAAAPGKPVAVAAIIDELWGEAVPQDPRGAVQIHFSRLRHWLAEAGVPTGVLRFLSGGYVLDVPRDRIDAVRFSRLATAALAVRDDPGARLARADQALAEWGGPPFEGCIPGPRLEADALHLEELWLQVREARAEALLDAGVHGTAIAELRSMLVAQPARERLVGLTMRALYGAGRQREAVEVFQAHRRWLIDEYGLEPSPALASLEAEILAHRVDSAPASAAVGAAAPLRPPTPRPLITGRERELAVVADALADGRSGRVVVVTGEAGAGKTTLATAALHDAAGAGAVTGLAAWEGDDAPFAAWIQAIDALGSGALVSSSANVAAARRAVMARLADVARRRPVLVVLEDAHLADSVSLRLLTSIAGHGLPTGAVILVTARVPDVVERPMWLEAHADLVRHETVTEVAVGDLTEDAVRAATAATLGHLPPAAVRRLADLVWVRSNGHALHLAAILDVIRPFDDEEACREAAMNVPTRLQPLFRYQLASLPRGCVDVVHALAVLGATPLAGLAAACGSSPAEVASSVRPACDLGLVVAEGGDLRLRHALTQQAIRDVIPASTAYHLHLARLDDLERRGADPFTVVRHAAGAGALVAPERLARARLAAGQVAYGRGAFAEAVDLLRPARHVIGGRADLEVDLYLGLALTALGRTEEADDLLDAVVDHVGEHPDIAMRSAVGHEPLGLSAHGDPRRLARLQRVFASTAGPLTVARLDVVRALLLEESLVEGTVRTASALRELERLAEHLDDDAGRARLAAMRAREHVDSPAEPAARLEAAEAAYDLAQRSGDHVLILDAIELVMSAALAAGQLERCVDLRWALAQEGRRANRARSIWAAMIVEAALLLAGGDSPGADERAQVALDAGMSLGIPDAVGAFAVHVVTSRWLSGELHTLLPIVAQGIAAYPNVPAWHAVAAAAHLQGGEREEARRSLAEFLGRREQAMPFFDRPGLCFAAPVIAHLRDEEAARRIEGALTAHRDAIVVVGVGAAVLGPVNLYVALIDVTMGRLDDAAVHVDEAEAKAAELGWSTWVEAARTVRRRDLGGADPPGAASQPARTPDGVGPAAGAAQQPSSAGSSAMSENRVTPGRRSRSTDTTPPA